MKRILDVAPLPMVSVQGDNILIAGELRGIVYRKNELYTGLLVPRGIDYKMVLSKKLLPDEAILAIRANLLTVIDMKFQDGGNSADWKLPTCDFKRRQYARLLAPAGIDVQFVYVLNNSFRHPRYRDALEYVRSVGCHYFFYRVSIAFLKL